MMYIFLNERLESSINSCIFDESRCRLNELATKHQDQFSLASVNGDEIGPLEYNKNDSLRIERLSCSPLNLWLAN